MIVGLDLDGVLNDVHQWIYQDVKNKFGIDFFWDEADLSKLSVPKKVISFIKTKCFGNPSYMNNIPATEEAIECVERLKGVSEIDKVYIVTGRSSSPAMVAQTEAWADEWFQGSIDGVFFSGYKKGNFLKNLGVELYVEDMLEQAINVVDTAIHCYLIDKPYNKDRDYWCDILRRKESLKSCIDDIVVHCAFRSAIRSERR